MSVKFTPGPHPTSNSRQNSYNINPTPNPSAQNSPITIKFPKASDRSHMASHPRSPYPPNLPHSDDESSAAATANNDHHNNGRGMDPGDAERQPLIGTREVNRPRIWWSILLGTLIIIFVGMMIGFGGWRLGKGTGGGRWPGSPG
ncbi:hypothetical protein I317_04164 [Kwoniella heveanensis CBS 569]|uniref:Uncharacterized protein n=1 Tax=Kwoniella heveanensis BCC8398 TaxID=1296120 RepID=A0A1B9GTY4_9TREE|nr:hypothetical protein I316_03829 [Kwoniella heveanensis BCC8398]OCF41972.1 hypothetical protein I317_04164 [Kwoniella heveanensis CBS 569]